MISDTCTVIAFTGGFGSGCTDAATHAHHQRGFGMLKLSTVVRDIWAEEHPGVDPTRTDLQKLGDALREAHGPEYLARVSIEQAEADDEVHALLVVDSVRNLMEVDYLRYRFGQRFTLIAVLSPPEARWNRVEHEQYLDRGLTEADFHDDDDRDRNEETSTGQQVELCIDGADIFIVNTGDVPLPAFRQKILEYVDLVTGATPRGATEDEVFMHMAFSSSHSSQCLKRHVGAILVNDRGDVVGVGYNENPTGTAPCVMETAYGCRCYRDLVRDRYFADMHKRGRKCPVCSAPIEELKGPPWRCSTCAQNGDRTDLALMFFPDRAMNWCTAVHAEVRAILAAGRDVMGTRLYTTTFPCFQCAEKVSQAGISEVIFTEVYPDVEAADRLDIADIDYRQFEGVRSAAFERIFPRPQ